MRGIVEQLTDEALLDQYFAGDAEAFRVFYRRHIGRVVSYAVRKGMPQEIATEVGQEAGATVMRLLESPEK